MSIREHLQHPGKGLLIVFEGPDGSGKSTAAMALVHLLTALDIPVVHTCEPTRSSYGIKARKILAEGQVSERREDLLDLFTRDREQHVLSLVVPALQKGKVVVQDRNWLSTAIYQGRDEAEVRQLIIEHKGRSPRPDLFFIVTAPTSELLRRVAERRMRANPLGSSSIDAEAELVSKYAHRYDAVIESSENGSIVSIPSAGSKLETFNWVFKATVPHLERHLRS